MAFVGFADDAALYDATAIDNMFIIEYLPTAPDAFLKVYLYARMLCLHPELGDMDELMRALNMDEDAVMNAFAYWERAGLVRRIADNPPEYRFISPRSGVVNEYDRDYYKYRDFNGALQDLFPKESPLLHPAQYSLANDWVENLGLSKDAVIALVKHMVETSRSKTPDPANVFRRADKKAMQLLDAGITDEAGVLRELSADNEALKTARDVIKQLGMRRNPTRPEQDMVSKWMREWGASVDDIIAACADTVKSANPSFGYLDTILKNRIAPESDRESMRRVLVSLGNHQAVSDVHMKWYSDMKKMGFEPGVIEFAAAQQAQKKNVSLSGVEKLLGMWKLRGLFALKDAEEYVARNRALYEEFAAVLHRANIDRPLGEQEIVAYDVWKQSLSAELIAHAAVNSAGKADPVRYMSNLIGRWIEAGVKTPEEAENLRSKSGNAVSAAKVNPALDYEQRDYTKMELDDDLFMETARRFLDEETGKK